MVKNISHTIKLALLVSCMFFVFKTEAQTVYATSAQKAQAKYVTTQKKDASEERREDYENASAEALFTPPSYKKQINGPEDVERYSQQSYYAVPPAPTGAWWYVTSGSVLQYYDDIITLQFNTSASFVDIMLFAANDTLMAKLRVNITTVANPLSAGQILTGSQSINIGDTATNILATAASGGDCNGAYQYQWQFSYNDTTFKDIEDATTDSLIFESYIDQTVYFRRKVVCGIDSQYTGSVVVFLIPQLAGGTISTANKTIFRNTTPPPLNTTPPANGNCLVYQYQWQKSTDGQSFVDISGATNTTYSATSSIALNTYYRRKVSCAAENAYTNIVLIRVKDVVSNIQVQSRIDSLINSAGVNLASIFNLQNDSVANNRLPANSALDSLEESYYDKQQLFSMNNTYSTLTSAQLNEIQNAPAVDSIDYKTNPTNHFFDSATAYIPFLDSATIDGYRLQGDYAGLDSIVQQVPKISFAEASHNLEVQLYSLVPDSQRTYNPQLNLWNTRPSIVINGPVNCNYFQTAHYTASFYYPPTANTNIEWVVSGGTILGQNINPTNGVIYIDILWQSNFTGTRSLMIYEHVSEEYGVLLPFFKQRDCLIFPSLQEIYYGQTPNYLNVAPCYNVNNVTSYQWQQLDIYSTSTWIPIVGATSEAYQPSPLSRPWMMYRRITITGVDDVFISSAASIKLHKVDPGVFTAAATNVTYNSIPIITLTRAASGGMLVPPGGTYTYTWEASINSGAWQQIGTGATFPNYAITQAQQIRWVATITGVPQSVYSLPEMYWKGYSQPIQFTVNGQNPSSFENRNFIRENTVLTRGINTWVAARDLVTEKKIQNTTYLDGLSRPIQVVGKGTHFDEQNNQWYDMVQDVTYEAGGRVDKALLPYPTTFNLGKFKTNVVTEQPAYFQNKFGDATAFAKVEYDNSPLNIVKKSFAPGDGWGGVGSNISVSGKVEIYYAYEEVHKFTIGYTQGEVPLNTGIYASNTLIKSVGTDEKGKRVVTYSDKIGNTILKKVQLADDFQLSQQHNGWLCTYYVYDDFNQLRYTITPKAVKELETTNWVISNDIANELCYWYDFDDLGRTIAKKTPGKGAEYVLYDKRDRPVFTTDAALISTSTTDWLTTLYDDLDRPVLSGIYKMPNQTTNVPDIAALQNLIDNAPINVQIVNSTHGGNLKLWNSPLTTSTINNSTNFTQLSFKYYDDYTYSGAKTFNAVHTQNLAYKNISTIVGDVESTEQTKRYNGMLTGQKVRILNDNNTSPTFLITTLFFDEEARIMQGQEDNIKGGVEITSSQYHFDGRVLSNSETHAGELAPFTNFNTLTKYKFDKIGRVIGVAKKLVNSNRTYHGSTFDSDILEDADADYKVLASYKYNELNQRSKKILSPNYNNGQGLETLDYSYNIRGWLTGINKDYALGEQSSNQWQHYFGLYLGYDNRDNKFAAAQYNGSITGVMWKSQGDNTPRKFDYEYDNANRLVAANFNQRGIAGEAWNRTKVDFSSKNIAYDENGNLLSLTQMGILPGGTAPIEVDKLNYVYYNRSNKLKRVDDISSNPANGKQGDFIDKNHNLPIDDYNYDNNGRLIFDNNKRISLVTYNYLDKPSVITIAPPQGSTGGGTVKYIYNAGGEKLQKIVTENPSAANNNQQRIVTTTYISGFVYEKVTTAGNTSPDVVQMIQHEEGRIRIVAEYINPQDPGNELSGGINLSIGKMAMFDYYIKDNLGNVRATLTEEVNKAAATCTMEDAIVAVKDNEEALFGNPGTNNEVATTRITKPQSWQSNISDKVSKLQATGGIAKTGPNAILHVMAGDKIRAKADYYYQTDPGSSGSNTGLQGMLNSFLTTISSGGRLPTVNHGQETQIGNQLENNYQLQNMFNNPPAGSNPNPNAPRAYLNYIFFDEQFNFVPELSGFKRVSQSGDGATSLVLTEAKATKNGYVYIYLSNESAEPVYFDNFAVAHDRGQLISEDHYYAYGLKIASISSKSISSSLNPSINKRGYQGSFSEEITEFELNYNEFELRTYDPQIGRWTTPDPYDEFASPYVGMGNDPINNVDPTGGFIDGISSGILRNLIAALKVLVPATTLTAGLATGLGQFNGELRGNLVGMNFTDPPSKNKKSLNYKVGKYPVFMEEFLYSKIRQIDIEYSKTAMGKRYTRIIQTGNLKITFLMFSYEKNKAKQDANGAANLKANPTQVGNNKDKTAGHEVAYKSTKQGGALAMRRITDALENSLHGSALGRFYKEFNMQDGDIFFVPLEIEVISKETSPAKSLVPSIAPAPAIAPIASPLQHIEVPQIEMRPWWRRIPVPAIYRIYEFFLQPVFDQMQYDDPTRLMI